MFVTNSLSYLAQVDEVFVIKNGCLVKQGPYSSLNLNENLKMHETSFVTEDANNKQKGFFLIKTLFLINLIQFICY